MVSLNGSSNVLGAAQTLLSARTPSVSSSSFAQQLEAALEQFMGQSGNGSHLEIDIRPAAGTQSSGASQFLVTVTTAPAAVSPAPAGIPSAAAASSVAAASSAPAASDTAQVTFGNSTITIPSLSAEIANQDRNLRSPLMTPDAILGEDQCEQECPWAQQPIDGTNLKWDDLTQDQQLAIGYGADWGYPAGQTMQQYLDAHVGPHIMANAPANNPYLFGNS
jgi:hypothetical protein